MSTIVLIHGAFANHHVWDLVAPKLEEAGLKVLAVDLPGHGEDQTPHCDITLQTYIDHVANIVTALPGDAILVGHSVAGMTISGVAERIPERISKVVYLAAALPRNGQSFLDLMRLDENSLIGRHIECDDPDSGVKLNKVGLFAALGEGQITQVVELLMQIDRFEPCHAFLDKIELTDERFGNARKFYIHTTYDHTISSELQQKLIAENGPVEKVYKLEAGHLRFLAFPDGLIEILTEVTKA